MWVFNIGFEPQCFHLTSSPKSRRQTPKCCGFGDFSHKIIFCTGNNHLNISKYTNILITSLKIIHPVVATQNIVCTTICTMVHGFAPPYTRKNQNKSRGFNPCFYLVGSVILLIKLYFFPPVAHLLCYFIFD